MGRHQSFKRSTTAEDGDMALAMALDQAERQRSSDPAIEQPLNTGVWTSLHPAVARDTALQQQDAGFQPDPAAHVNSAGLIKHLMVRL